MLKTKIKRDVKKDLSQYVTIFLMIFIGIFIYTGINAYMIGMQKSADDYYKENNLQDFNAYGSFKEKDIDTIKNIKNVKDVNAILTLPELASVANKDKHKVRVNYINDNTVSKFYIVKGEKFKKNKSGIWLDYYYAKENCLKIGDILELNYGDVLIKNKIKGFITVPDKVMDVKDETSLIPSHEDYANIYISSKYISRRIMRYQIMKEQNIESKEKFEELMPSFNYKDYIRYNKMIIDVDNKKNIKSVKEEVKKFKRTQAIVDIKNELSYSSYQSEIDEGNSFIGIFSGLFIFIALLSVITTMTRLIKRKRTEIGTLKALGFSKKVITIYYMLENFKLSFWACITGMITGYFLLGKYFIDLEMTYYEIPNYKAGFDIKNIYVSIFSIICVLIFTYLSTRKILKLNAAETLRAERPKVNIKSIEMTKSGIFERLSFSDRWNIRDILRNKMRTFMGFAGIIGCMILLVCAFGIKDTIDEYLKVQFYKLNNYEYKINIPEEVSEEELNHLYTKYGDKTSKSVQVEIAVNDKIISNNIFITNAGDLVRFMDENNNYLTIKDGVYITRKLAQNEGYKIGDKIKWHIYGSDKYYETKIIGFNKDPQNQNITMNKKYYESLGLKYIPDSLYTNKDLKNVTNIKGILSFQSKAELKTGIDTMLDVMKSMIAIISFVAVFLCIIIIYNIGVLSFAEKNYQFATLKVLGFNNSKISKIFVKQNIWISICATIIGIPIGIFVVKKIFISALSAEYDFEIKISFLSLLVSTLITLLTAFLVSKVLGLKIRKIDMVSSLKGNE